MRRECYWFIGIILAILLGESGALAATSVWLSNSPTGSQIPNNTITVPQNSRVQLYCFLTTDAVGNTLETMVGYDTSSATGTSYGGGVGTAQSGKITLVSAQSDIYGSMDTTHFGGVFTAASQAVVMNASGREISNSSLSGKPFGFVGRLATTSNAAVSSVKCFSFTLQNNMTTLGDSQYVVVSNYAGANSYSTAWKYGTALYENTYALKVVNGSNLPTVGATNKATLSALMGTTKSNYTWKFWGVVSNRTASGFTIDDGSGAPINVVAPSNTVANGNYVSVKGTLDTSTNPATLTSQQVTDYH